MHPMNDNDARIGQEEGLSLEQAYWLRRKREELAMALRSISAEARMIHFDLAGRYSVKASNTEEIAAHVAIHSEA